jgi:hypothetical protein
VLEIVRTTQFAVDEHQLQGSREIGMRYKANNLKSERIPPSEETVEMYSPPSVHRENSHH